MNIQEILLNSLEELGSNDFKKFQSYLSDSGQIDFKPIPKSFLEDPLEHVTVDHMVERYGHGRAVTVTLGILRKMNLNENARKLEEKTCCGSAKEVKDQLKPSEQVECTAAPPSTPSGSVSVSANHSVVLLPTLNHNHCSTGSINFNINIQK
ncbi:unnamed protein product [Arctogadus glacialis]